MKTLSERLDNLKFDKRTSFFKKLKDNILFNESDEVSPGYNREYVRKVLENVVSWAEHYQKVNGNCKYFDCHF